MVPFYLKKKIYIYRYFWRIWGAYYAKDWHILTRKQYDKIPWNMFIVLSVETWQHIQNAKYNDYIQQLALREVIYILKAGLVCTKSEMPITCRRTVIHANVAASFLQACVRTRTRARTHTGRNNCALTHSVHTGSLPQLGFYYWGKKVTFNLFVLLLQWITRKKWYNYIHSHWGKGQRHDSGPALKQSSKTTIYVPSA